MHKYQYKFSCMGSPCALHLYAAEETVARQAAEQAIVEARRLEQKYSRFIPDSILEQLNSALKQGKSQALDSETLALLEYAHTAWGESNGLFDISSGVLREVWDFHKSQLPKKQELHSVLQRVGWQHIKIDGHTVRCARPGMQLDLGGVVKEYAADTLAKRLRDLHISAGLVDLGGDMAVVGARPDGQPWAVGIRHPRAEGKPIASIELSGGGLASSGDYERFMRVDGQRYCHILRPDTGFPAQGLVSVSAVASHCILAGTAATTAMLMDETEALEWLHGLGLSFVAVGKDLTIYSD